MSTLLYILSANLDSVGVGFSYGVRKIHISRRSLVIIAVISAFCSAFSLFIGKVLGTILAQSAGNFLGRSILFLLGFWIFLTSFKSDGKSKKSHSFSIKFLGVTVSIMKDPALCDFDSSSKIEEKEALYLALALSLDSIAIGLGLGISGIFTWYLPLLIGISQYIFLEIGKFMGIFLTNKFKISHKFWTLLAGLCLIVLAIWG